MLLNIYKFEDYGGIVNNCLQCISETRFELRLTPGQPNPSQEGYFPKNKPPGRGGGSSYSGASALQSTEVS